MLDLSQVGPFPTTSFTVLATGLSFFERGMWGVFRFSDFLLTVSLTFAILLTEMPLTNKLKLKQATRSPYNLSTSILFYHHSNVFLKKQHFFSTQRQCCLTFSWLELQMLLRCCLIPIIINMMRHILYLLYLSTFRPRGSYATSMWSIFHLQHYFHCH